MLRCVVWGQTPRAAEETLLTSMDDVSAEIYTVGDPTLLEELDGGESYEIRLRCVIDGESRRAAELELLSQLDDVPAEIYLA